MAVDVILLVVLLCGCATAGATGVGAQPAVPEAVARHAGSEADPAGMVLVFISQRMFHDDALAAVTRRLETGGFRVVVAAKDTSLAVGMDQTVVRPDRALESCRPADFAALVLINGSGIAVYWQDSLLLARCREFADSGKVMGSIGIAGICLANAGVLRSRKATIIPNRHAVRRLLAGGARYRPNPVVTDRNVVTASGAEHARSFAQVLIGMLKQKDKQR